MRTLPWAKVFVAVALCGLVLSNSSGGSPRIQATTSQAKSPTFDVADDLDAGDVFKEYAEQLITGVGLAPEELSNLILDLRSMLTVNKGWNVPSDAELREVVLAGRVDIGEGRDSGLVVRGNSRLYISKRDSPLRGATGNCQTWIMRKANQKWQAVFDGGPSGFGFLPTKHNGLYDLATERHWNCCEVPIEVLHFDGTKYVHVQNYCRYNEEGRIAEGPCK